jgi:hypothetical protein
MRELCSVCSGGRVARAAEPDEESGDGSEVELWDPGTVASASLRAAVTGPVPGADVRRVVKVKVQMRGSRKKSDQAQDEPEGETAEKK